MDRSRKLYVAKCAAILSAVPILIWAHSSGPPPRSTGAPGDLTCSQASCHLSSGSSGTPVNGGGGKVQISFDSGSTYAPGAKVHVTVTVTDPAARRIFGFQATARLISNTRNGQAGTFTPSTEQFVQCEDGGDRPNTGCRSSGPIEFIQHSTPSSTGVFQFDWTAPAAGAGDVKFYVAGNAANGDGQASGLDHIYTAEATLTVSSGGPKPTISDGGVADSFNFKAGTAPATWTAIFGSNLSTTTRTWVGSDFTGNKLPTALDGVSVTINNKPAYVYFISPAQINVLAPDDTATGNVSVVVTNANGASAPLSITKSNILPAFYAPFGQNGKLYVTAVDPASNPANPTLLGKVGLDPRVTRGVKPGEVILLYGTGFGVTNPVTPTDSIVTTAFPLATTPIVRFGDTQADVVFAGQSGSGLYQFNVKVPNVAAGDVPLTAQIGSVTSPSTVVITVQP